MCLRSILTLPPRTEPKPTAPDLPPARPTTVAAGFPGAEGWACLRSPIAYQYGNSLFVDHYEAWEKTSPTKAAELFFIQATVIYTTIARAVQEALDQFVGEQYEIATAQVNARDVFKVKGS